MLHVLPSHLHKEPLPADLGLEQSFVDASQVVAVLTGGSEALFLNLVRRGQISLQQPIYLIATEQSNSLAACLEILSWINLNHGNGEIRCYRSAK